MKCNQVHIVSRKTLRDYKTLKTFIVFEFEEMILAQFNPYDEAV